MCGVFGAILYPGKSFNGRHRDKLRVLINALAVSSASRGEDASGIAVVNRLGTIEHYKDAIPSYELVARRAWKRLIRNSCHPADTFALIGHTRYGTHGKNSRANAHPFIMTDEKRGSLVGTHNGVVDNHDTLVTEVHSVDSANVFRRLSQESLDDWKTTLGLLEGRFALVYSRGGYVYMARNSGSPCYIGWCPELSAVVYASTKTILLSSAALADIVLETVHEIATRNIYVFNQQRPRPLRHKIIVPKKIKEDTSSTITVRKKVDSYDQNIDVSYLMCCTCGALTKKEKLIPLSSTGRPVCKKCSDKINYSLFAERPMIGV